MRRGMKKGVHPSDLAYLWLSGPMPCDPTMTEPARSCRKCCSGSAWPFLFHFSFLRCIPFQY